VSNYKSLHLYINIALRFYEKKFLTIANNNKWLDDYFLIILSKIHQLYRVFGNSTDKLSEIVERAPWESFFANKPRVGNVSLYRYSIRGVRKRCDILGLFIYSNHVSILSPRILLHVAFKKEQQKSEIKYFISSMMTSI